MRNNKLYKSIFSLLKKNRIIFIVFILLKVCSFQTVYANVFYNVELSRKSVYVQQSFRVNITVYTTTWFTAPLEFGNLQIPNAFIVPFDKTQPGMFTVNGKQYPGIQFYYIVFPYKVGDFSVPSIEITAQSPAEGSSQSQKIVLETAPQSFTVKDVPKELKNKANWFVAKDVTIKDSWDPPLKDLKVGDVVKRTITIDAKGTLPQFIPDLSGQENVNWASTYPQDAVLTDTRDESDANGRSAQTVTYLFEKAGDYEVPSIDLSYWNPYSSKMFTHSTGAVKVHVADNPNLGILTSLKDSLNATRKTVATSAEEKGPFLILGIRWYYFVGILLVLLILGYCLIRLGINLFRKYKNRRQAYQQSEEYYFHEFMKSSGQSPKKLLQSLYTWWDSLSYTPSSSVKASFDSKEEFEEAKEIQKFLSEVYGKSDLSKEDIENVKKIIKQYRENQVHESTDLEGKHEKLSGFQKEWT